MIEIDSREQAMKPSMQQDTSQRPADQGARLAGRAFGETIYWTTWGASILGLAGMIFAFTVTGQAMDPASLLAGLWRGLSVPEIWQTVGGQPSGHWYLRQLHTGNGLMTAGIALGVFSVIPAMLVAGGLLWRGTGRRLFALFAGLAVAIAGVAVLGW